MTPAGVDRCDAAEQSDEVVARSMSVSWCARCPPRFANIMLHVLRAQEKSVLHRATTQGTRPNGRWQYFATPC